MNGVRGDQELHRADRLDLRNERVGWSGRRMQPKSAARQPHDCHSCRKWQFQAEISGPLFPVRRRSRGRGQLTSKYRAGCRARKHHVACVPPLAGPAMPGSAVPAAGGLAMYRPQPRVKFASASGISASASTATWARTISARLAWTRPHGPRLTKTAVSPASTAGQHVVIEPVPHISNLEGGMYPSRLLDEPFEKFATWPFTTPTGEEAMKSTSKPHSRSAVSASGLIPAMPTLYPS